MKDRLETYFILSKKEELYVLKMIVNSEKWEKVTSSVNNLCFITVKELRLFVLSTM